MYYPSHQVASLLVELGYLGRCCLGTAYVDSHAARRYFGLLSVEAVRLSILERCPCLCFCCMRQHCCPAPHAASGMAEAKHYTVPYKASNQFASFEVCIKYSCSCDRCKVLFIVT